MIKTGTDTSPSIGVNIGENRRTDHVIRTAINEIQTLLFDPQASEKIFCYLLEHVVKITESDYGVSFLATPDGLGSIDAGSEQNLYSIHSETGGAFIRAKTLKAWVNQKIFPIRPTFFNAPIPKSYKGLLIQSNDISSLVILPIISRDKLRSICILAKRNGEYSGDIVRRLMPLLGSVVCALQSAESVKGNTQAFDKKITDNRYLNSLLACSPIAVLVVSSSNTIALANPAAEKMFGVSNDKDKLYNKNIVTFIPHFEDLFQWSNQRSRYGEDAAIMGPQLWEDKIAKRADDSQFIVNMTIFRYTHAGQRFTTLQLQDITAIRDKSDEYQQASQQLNALTHLVPVGIIRVDSSWNCLYANDKWYEFSGLINEETKGQHWINALHSDDVKLLLDDLREALQIGSDYQKEVRLVSPLGQIRWVDFNTRVLFDESGSVIGFLGTFQDVTERLIHQEKLRHIAEYDSLTGLANRNLFQDRLEQVFFRSERDNAVVSVLFLDLDGFKDVNDTLGHDVGDLLLQKVAERLLNSLRRNDTVARFGGDEFVILLGLNEKENKISEVANKIIETIAKPYVLGDHEVFITISIGIANGTYFNSSPKQILKQADAALYLAKREGKNTFQLFSANLNRESQQRIKLANQLRHALSSDRYQLHYQPIASMATREVIGFEALLRFTNDNGNIIGPDQFIPILEETGMMIDAGKWVIEEACKQLSDWQLSDRFPENGFLSFNVSPKQLLSDCIITTIKDACKQYSIKPHYLVMEITESVIISKPKKVDKILTELKNIGLRFAMDDFGTGYSSLSYLQKYPFDHLKVDRSFVEDLLTDENNANITRAIISLAQSLGLKVTAEGVESAEVLERLKIFGADHYQGYLLGRPSLPDDLLPYSS